MFKFYKKIFLLNLKDYPNIGIDLPITVVLFFLFLAFMLVTIIVNYRRAKMELMIRQLKRHNALNQENAKTLTELRLNSFIFRRLLSVEGQLTKLVQRVGEKEYTYEEYLALSSKDRKNKINFAEAKFFIRESEKERAEKIMDAPTPTVLNTILLSVLIIALFICVSLALPSLLELIDNYIGQRK